MHMVFHAPADMFCEGPLKFDEAHRALEVPIAETTMLDTRSCGVIVVGAQKFELVYSRKSQNLRLFRLGADPNPPRRRKKPTGEGVPNDDSAEDDGGSALNRGDA